MVSKSKLCLFWFIFWCLAPFLLRGLTWVKLCTWTQNHPKKVGTCPGLTLQLIFQIEVSKTIGLTHLKGGGGGLTLIFFVKLDFEIAVDQQTRACERTFVGQFSAPILPNHLNMFKTMLWGALFLATNLLNTCI